MKPGFHEGISFDEYRNLDALNHSTLKMFRRSPAHARWQMLHQSPSSEAQVLGSATHCAILEPAMFSRLYVQAPKLDRRTKAGKAAWAEFQEQYKVSTILKPEQFQLCMAMSNAVWQHPKAKELLAQMGKSEVTVVAEIRGVLCKMRLDRLIGKDLILDLKTTRDASPKLFGRDMARFHYHSQAAFYSDGVKKLGRKPRFLILAVENEPPHGVAIYEPDRATLDQGRYDYEQWMGAYKTAREAQSWPSYPEEIQPLTIPKWAFTPDERIQWPEGL